jgi:ABC-type spermidine/putrescine transport system permease subunit II
MTNDPKWLQRAEAESQKAPAVHDGMAVAAIIFAFLFWPLGLYFASVSKRESARAGRQVSALTTAALFICRIGIAIVALVLIAPVVRDPYLFLGLGMFAAVVARLVWLFASVMRKLARRGG